MATLEELAGLAALIMGQRYQNKQIGRANRVKLEQQAKEDKYRQDLLNYRMQVDAGEAKRAGEAAKLRERTGRISQLRQAYMPLLNMGRTPADQAELSRNPERYQALLADQADIQQLLAQTDDTAWENFRPRFYGGQGFVAPPPAAPEPDAPQQPGRGVMGLFGGAAPQQPAAPAPPQPAAPAPPPMITTDPLGNPLSQPMPMTHGAGPAAPQPGMDPLGNPLAALFGAPGAAPKPSWFTQPIPQPLKDAATTANLTSQTNERNAMLQHEINEAIANKNYKVAQTKLAELAQLTEKEKPAEVRARTKATESLPGYRAGQLDLGAERNEQGWASLDLQEKLGYAHIHSAEGIAAANRSAKSAAGPQVPEGSKPFVARLAALATATMRQASGSERPLTQGEREAQAAQINAEHDRAFGIPLFGPDGVLSEANVVAAPGAGSAAPAAGAAGGLDAEGRKIKAYIDAGQFDALMGSPALANPNFRKRAKALYRQITGKMWSGK